MKKSFLAAVLITVINSSLFSQNVPQLLKGIWFNQDRYIVFDTGNPSDIENVTEPNFVLRTFYTWYDDFACGNKENLDKNNTTSQELNRIRMEFIPFFESNNSGAWDMIVYYNNGRDVYHIPVAVIDKKLYLNFKIHENTGDSLGYWQDFGSSRQITINSPVVNDELKSFFITENAVYYIRYWQTKMDYDAEAYASFSDGEYTYSVKKHINAGGKTYTCVNGRSTTIRNIDKSESLEDNYIFNSEKTICAFAKPYLTLDETGMTLEEIMQKANSRHKPLPKPVFPPDEPNFNWDVITDLRKYTSKDVKKYNRNLSIGKN